MGVYQRGNNWYIDFTFHGQRIREMIGPSKKGAGKVISERKAEIAENKFLDVRKDPEPIKFHDFAKRYLEWSKTNKKPSTCKRELYTLRMFDEEFKGMDIQQIGEEEIEAVKVKRKESCKPASVNRELCLLKHLFSMATKWKDKNGVPFLKESPARNVCRLKGETKRLRFLMPNEVQSLLSNCDGLLHGLLMPLATVAVHTGARKGELQSLKWPEINFELGIITFLETKNGERRDIRMDETVRSTIGALERKSEYVFPNRNGKRIDDAQIQIAFAEALRRSGIEDFRFHDLRHTFASNLVMAGTDLYTVGELLGHKDVKMTKRYAHLAPAYKAKAVNILDGVFGMSQIPPQEKVLYS